MKKLTFFLTLTFVFLITFSNNLIANSSISQEEYNTSENQNLNETSSGCFALTKTNPQNDLQEFAHICQEIADYVSTSLYVSYGWDAEDAIMVGEIVEGACCELVPGC